MVIATRKVLPSGLVPSQLGQSSPPALGEYVVSMGCKTRCHVVL